MMIFVNKALKRVFSRFKKSEHGVTALEFAIVGPPFLFLMGSLFETGIMLFFEYAIAQKVEEAGRLVRTGQMQMGTSSFANSEAGFKDAICKKSGGGPGLDRWLNCQEKLHVDVRVHNNFAQIKNNLPTTFAHGSSGTLNDDITKDNEYDPGKAGEIVTVRVYYEYELFMPNILKLLNINTHQDDPNITLGNTGQNNNTRLLVSAATFRNEPFSDGS